MLTTSLQPSHIPASLLLLTPHEAAALLRISRTSLYRLVEARRLPFYRVGGVLRFSREDIARYLMGRRVEPIA